MEPEALQTIRERCSQSRQHNDRMRSLLPLDVAPSLRANFARCAIDLALEHHSGLVRLVEAGEYGTAAALLRPVLEASATAFWFVYVAPCRVIQQLPTEPIDNPVIDVPNLRVMLEELAPIFPPIAVISEGMKTGGSAKWLHKYAHGSTPQLTRRVGDRWSETEVLVILIRSDLFCVVAACLETVIAPNAALSKYGFGTRDELGYEAQMTLGIPPVPQQPNYLPDAPLLQDGCGPAFG